MRKRLKMYLTILGLVRIADAFGALLISFVIAAMDITDAQAGLLAGIAMVGMLIGAPLMGRLADLKGRRVAISLSIGLYSFFTLLSYRLCTYERLLALRLLAGIGIGGVLPTASTAFIELSPIERRGFYVSVFESMRAVGTLIVSLAAYLVIPKFGRRSMFLIGALPALLIPLVLLMSESPYYLASKGNLSEARRVAEELGLSFRMAEEGDDQIEYLRITLLVSVIRFSLALAYYGRTLRGPRYMSELGYSLKSSYSFLIYASIAMLIGYYTNAFIVDRIGRRKLLTLYTLLSAFALVIFSQMSTYEALVLSGMLFISLNAASWTVTYTYTPELYPTKIRGTAMGIAGAAARIGGFLGPLVIALYSFYPLAAFLLAASISARLIGIETTGKALNRGFLRASGMMSGGLP